jgi:hypothetical protein
MPEESNRSPRVVIYVSGERRSRLRRLASERFADEAGYASVSRVVNEILDSCLDEYEAGVKSTKGTPKRKR